MIVDTLANENSARCIQSFAHAHVILEVVERRKVSASYVTGKIWSIDCIESELISVDHAVRIQSISSCCPLLSRVHAQCSGPFPAPFIWYILHSVLKLCMCSLICAETLVFNSERPF